MTWYDLGVFNAKYLIHYYGATMASTNNVLVGSGFEGFMLVCGGYEASAWTVGCCATCAASKIEPRTASLNCAALFSPVPHECVSGSDD